MEESRKGDERHEERKPGEVRNEGRKQVDETVEEEDKQQGKQMN